MSKHFLEGAEDDISFQPKGSIAFFLFLIFLDAVIWFSFYYLLLKRN